MRSVTVGRTTRSRNRNQTDLFANGYEGRFEFCFGSQTLCRLVCFTTCYHHQVPRSQPHRELLSLTWPRNLKSKAGVITWKIGKVLGPPRARIRHSERVIQVPRRRLRETVEVTSIMTGIRQRSKNVRAKTKTVKSLINTFVYKGFCRLVSFLTYLNLCPSFTLQTRQLVSDAARPCPVHVAPTSSTTLQVATPAPPRGQQDSAQPRAQDEFTNTGLPPLETTQISLQQILVAPSTSM